MAGGHQQAESKRNSEKGGRISVLSVENNPNPNSKNISDVKDGRVNTRVTMATGAGGEGTLETLVPNVNLEHTGAPQDLCRSEWWES